MPSSYKTGADTHSEPIEPGRSRPLGATPNVTEASKHSSAFYLGDVEGMSKRLVLPRAACFVEVPKNKVVRASQAGVTHSTRNVKA